MISRPQRFDTAFRLLWRPRGGNQWFEGLVVNTSRTGVLFRPNLPVQIDTPIDFLLPMGHEHAASVNVADVLCTGRIVRTTAPAGPSDDAMVAATIDSYVFLREP